MSLSPLRLRRGRLIGLAFVLAAMAPGCAWEQVHCPRPEIPYAVQRPIYPVAGTKPLYLGGYAGAYYGPGR